MQKSSFRSLLLGALLFNTSAAWSASWSLFSTETPKEAPKKETPAVHTVDAVKSKE